jgi:hypothetical protein
VRLDLDGVMRVVARGADGIVAGASGAGDERNERDERS